VNVIGGPYLMPVVVALMVDGGILPTGTTTLSQWFIRGAPRLCNMWSPLHWAAHYGDPEAMQALLDCKADINSRTDIDRTPLHETGVQNTGANGLAVVRFMLEHGVNTNARMQGTTPLCCCVAYTLGSQHLTSDTRDA